MKRFSISTQVFTQVLAITLIISACGPRAVVPQATPTINPTELQKQVTAIAATYMAAAETQAAIPTATQPAPTATVMELPDFTQTALFLPTSDVTPSPTSTVNPYAGDPCVNQKMPDTLTGDKIKIRIDNPTKATINVSVYLQSSTPQGVCGYRAYIVAPMGNLVITDLVVGCYSLWAWNPDPKNYFMVTNGTSCLDNSQIWTFNIIPNSNIQLK